MAKPSRFFERTGAEYVVVDAGMEHDLRDMNDDEKTNLEGNTAPKGVV